MTVGLDDRRRRAEQQWTALKESPRIRVGTATCGRSAGAGEVLDVFRRQMRRRGIDSHLIEVGCTGLCYAEPIVSIGKPSQPEILYGNVTPEKAVELVGRYLAGDDPCAEAALGTMGDGSVDGIPRLAETSVFKPQVRRTLRNCGLIDPGNIDHYLAHGGYRGLAAALDMGPEAMIEQVQQSGLRGCGGAGFPTWRKWQFAVDAPSETKYLICNGSEGDPGTFSNKLLLESDPHSVLEGMLLAAYAIGACEGYIYCPSEYPLALERLRIALGQMEAAGLVGESILGSQFDFHIKLKEGAGAYICGEESALIECIEGARGLPRCRPPFPPVSGLWGHPTIVNNVETLACVTWVLQNGPERFAELGTEKSKGTKTFCLSGNVQRPGVVEVPFGTTLGEIVHSIGGGVPGGKKLKAVQTGGPAGGCLPPDRLDTPVDHDSLLPLGASLGSGGVVVMDEETCMVDLVRNSLEFAHGECCGKCAPCRLGTRQMLDILGDISGGKARAGDLELLVELAEAVKAGSFCGLGQTVPNPLLSVLRYFRGECEAHISENRCSAGACLRTRAQAACS